MTRSGHGASEQALNMAGQWTGPPLPDGHAHLSGMTISRGGWGWGAFDYDAASDTFTPATLADKPPQGNDAKCGFACHTIVAKKDYVFTEYGKR
jgi:Cytochrome P460